MSQVKLEANQKDKELLSKATQKEEKASNTFFSIVDSD